MARRLSIDEAYGPAAVKAPRRTISLDEAYAKPLRGRAYPPSRPLSETDKAVVGTVQRLGAPFAEAGRGFVAGVRASSADLWHQTGNALQLVRGALQKAGAPPQMADKALEWAEAYARDQSLRTAPPEPAETIAGKIWEGIGMAPGQIAEYAITGSLLGGPAGFAAVDALRAADQGPIKTAEEAAKGALFGGVLQATQPLRRLPRAAVVGGTAAGQAALEGAPLPDVVASGVTMAGLGAAGGPGQVRLRDLPIRQPAAPSTELLLHKGVEERPLVLGPETELKYLPPPAPPRARGTPNRARPPEIITIEDAYRPITERTAEGEQILVPGVKPVTEADRLKVAAEAPLAPKAPQKPADEGIFDLAGRGQGELIDLATAYGKKKHKAKYRPQDAFEFIASEGGIKDTEGHDLLRGRNLQTHVPFAGKLVKDTGKSLDEIGLKLWEAGYFGHPESRARPTVAEVLDLLEQAKEQKLYSEFDRPRVEELESKRVEAEFRTEVRYAFRELKRQAEERQLRTTPTMLKAAAEESVRSGRSPFDLLTETLEREAVEIYGMRQPGAPQAAKAPPLQATTPQGAAPQPMAPPGPNYVGMAAEAYGGATAAGAGTAAKHDLLGRPQPLSREEVLSPLVEALETSLYQGRVKKTLKRALGFYRPRLGEVRIESKADVETAAHELAHLLDDRNPEIRAAWRKGPSAKAFATELKGVSYDQSKVFEGFAEFVRLWMTQKDEVRRRVPLFHAWWEGWLDRSPQGPALRQAQEQMHQYFAQDPLLRAQSKIGQTRAINEHLDGAGDRFRQAVFDDLHGFLKLETALTGAVSPSGPYATARLTRAALSIVDGAIEFGRPVVRPDGSHGFEGKGLREILNPVARDLNNWVLYSVGKSASELKGQGRERLFTQAEIAAMRTLETPVFRKAFEEYQEWNRGVVDFAEAKGLIDPQVRGRWQRQWYLPFHRVGTKGQGAKRAGGLEGNVKAAYRLTGGTGNLRDILDNIVQNAGHLISEALKNEARREVVGLTRRIPGGGTFIAEIPADTRGVKIDTEQVLRKMQEAGVVERGPDGHWYYPDGSPVDTVRLAPWMNFWLFRQTPRPAGDENIIAVLYNGKPRYFQINDPLVYRAFEALSRKGKSWIVRALSVPRRIGQSTITLTPDFIAANLARDTIMAGIMSRVGYRPFIDAASGLVSRLSRDQAYREFIANGGGLASHLIEEGRFRTRLERFYTGHGIDYRTVLDSPQKLLAALETIADAFEVATRIGEFKRARQAGHTPRAAAYMAREVSTDFAMRGDSEALGFFYDTVIFLKAAMNSMDRLYRGASQDPNRAKIWTLTASLAGLSAALAAYNLEHYPEAYGEMEDWLKDTHWHFFVPLPDGETLHLKYPKIWEVGAISSIAERTIEATRDQAFAALPRHVWRIFADLFSVEAIPQAAAPLAEAAMNRDLFTGRRIIPQGREDLEPWLRTKSTTSELARRIGRAERNLPQQFQMPPAMIDHLIQGYFHTAGMYGLRLADTALGNAPALRTDQLPVIRRFYAGPQPEHTKYEEMFFDMVRAAERAHRSLNELADTAPELADEHERKRATELGSYRYLTRAKRMESQIRAEMNQVRDDTRLGRTTPQEARRQLDRLAAERNALMKEAVEGE